MCCSRQSETRLLIRRMNCRQLMRGDENPRLLQLRQEKLLMLR
jgi:hypothetical protein